MTSELSAHRMVEWAIALVLAVITLPLLLAVTAGSAIVYRASPLFIHERVGRHGRRFRFVKVRTLPPDTGRYLDKHAIGQAPIPRIMRVIRAMHLDEIPQLWLVLTGDLALVGPRAEMAVLHDRIRPEIAAERLAVRPGVTGLWQVSVHSDGLICDRVEYDRLYVRHRSARLDLWIAWITIRKMAFGHRIHLFQVPMWAVVEAPAPKPLPAPVPDVFIDLTQRVPAARMPKPHALAS